MPGTLSVLCPPPANVGEWTAPPSPAQRVPVLRPGLPALRPPLLLLSSPDPATGRAEQAAPKKSAEPGPTSVLVKG